MKNFKYMLLILAVAFLGGCKIEETPAPDPVEGLTVRSGIGRAQIEFSAPKGAVAGKVYYNAGSVKQFRIDKGSAAQSVVVDGLSEGKNTLRVVTTDIGGRESLPRGIVVDVLGEAYYAGTLPNRTFIKMTETGSNACELLFEKSTAADEAYVVVTYSDLAGQYKEAHLAPGETLLALTDVDWDLPIVYYTTYRPAADFLDVYSAVKVNVQDVSAMQLDKSAWRFTVGGSAAGSPAENMADGDFNTSWCAAEQGDQVIDIDMRSVKLFSGVILTQGWNLDGGTMASGLLVEASEDGSRWQTVVDKKFMLNCYSQQYPLSSPAKAQYLRITLSRPLDSRPIQLGEIDLYNDLFNTMTEELVTMPSIANGVSPIVSDGSDDLAPALGAGRMQRAVGWNASDRSLITTDTAVGGLCVWSANAWGIPNVVNGKVWQTIDLLPGYYSVDWNIGSVTDPRGVDVYGVVARGSALPDIDAAQTSGATIASFCIDSYRSSAYNLAFSLEETSTVTIGWVYNTYDLYEITGSIPWSDTYINSIVLNSR